MSFKIKELFCLGIFVFCCLPILAQTGAFFFEKSRTLAAQQAYAEALENIEKAIATDTQNLDWRMYKARLQSWNKNYDGAEKTLTQLLAYPAARNEAVLILADVYLWSKNTEQLKHLYENTPPLSINALNLKLKYATLLVSTGECTKAKKLLAIEANQEEVKRFWEKMPDDCRINNIAVRYNQFSQGTATRGYITELNYARCMPKNTYLVGLNFANRFGLQRVQGVLEMYPKLSKKTYLHIVGMWSDGIVLPQQVYGISSYFGLNKNIEIETGMRFYYINENEKLWILRGGLSKQWQKHLFAYRLFWVNGSTIQGANQVFSYRFLPKKGLDLWQIGIGSGISTQSLANQQLNNLTNNTWTLQLQAKKTLIKHWTVQTNISWELVESDMPTPIAFLGVLGLTYKW